MNNIDIYELLSKESLSVEEHELVDKLLTDNPEAQKISLLLNKIKNITRKGSHLDSEILSEYTLLKNGLHDGNNLSQKIISKIEDHLRKCEKCKNNFKMMNDEFVYVDNFVSDHLSEQKQKAKNSEQHNLVWWILQNQSNFKRAVYTMAAMVVVYFSVFTYYNITTPDYKKEINVFSSGNKFVSRGRISSEFQKGIAELDKHNFETAISNLITDIKDNENDKTIFYTYFILGKTYLEASKSSVFGLYHNYDKQKLEKSIEAFQKSIQKNNNPEFKHLNYDSYYFIARDLLLMDRLTEAKKYLQLVIDNKGSFKKDAERILKSLES